MSSRTTLAVLPMLALAVGGCDRAALTGPPTLRPGRDECAECGMIINEERCSSAMLVDRSGRREHLAYDDIGCMLDAERGGACGKVLERYVHDHDSRAWVRAEVAAYLNADPSKLQTPMGSGLVAFESAARAQAARAQFGGVVVEYSDLSRIRSEWLQARKR